MQPFNVALAEAMDDVATRFPDDLDVQTLAAEARMMEASREPAKALPSAEWLPTLVLGAGHLVHMPAHIYQRVGRYADASRANQAAVEVDAAYLAKVQAPGYYPMYKAHNHGFLACSAAMQGNAALALSAARRAASTMPRDLVCGMPGMHFFLSEPLLVLVRFGRWDDVLREAPPDAKYPVLTALHQHARGMALASTGKLDEARAAAQTIRAIRDELPEALIAGLNAGRLVLDVAAESVEARIAEAAHAPDAITRWQAAVKREHELAYNEPAAWFYPLRHYLGAALLDAGRAAEAEAVYREDLVRHPHNGWALFGLAKALGAQHKPTQRETERLFEAAWQDADVKLTRSAF